MVDLTLALAIQNKKLCMSQEAPIKCMCFELNLERRI
jgi:hypothetical protein